MHGGKIEKDLNRAKIDMKNSEKNVVGNNLEKLNVYKDQFDLTLPTISNVNKSRNQNFTNDYRTF